MSTKDWEIFNLSPQSGEKWRFNGNKTLVHIDPIQIYTRYASSKDGISIYDEFNFLRIGCYFLLRNGNTPKSFLSNLAKYYNNGKIEMTSDTQGIDRILKNLFEILQNKSSKDVMTRKENSEDSKVDPDSVAVTTETHYQSDPDFDISDDEYDNDEEDLNMTDLQCQCQRLAFFLLAINKQVHQLSFVQGKKDHQIKEMKKILDNAIKPKS